MVHVTTLEIPANRQNFCSSSCWLRQTIVKPHLVFAIRLQAPSSHTHVLHSNCLCLRMRHHHACTQWYTFLHSTCSNRLQARSASATLGAVLCVV
jgi:hypothetical protein